VFQPKSRPWVNMDAADNEKIKAQVDQCPSRALTWYANNAAEKATEAKAEKTRIQVTDNGPVLVHGNVDIEHPDGTVEAKEKVTAFCRCGMSGNKPFCDGTHRKESWVAK